jgi:Zn-dependent protease with chaperone function
MKIRASSNIEFTVVAVLFAGLLWNCGALGETVAPAPTTVDLTTIWSYALQALGAIIGAAVLFALKRLISWMGGQETAADQAAFDLAGEKVMAFAVSKGTAKIKQLGWDHPDVKSSVIAEGAQQFIDKFPDAMKAVGIDPADPAAAGRLADGVLERKFPAAMAAAAASPATPPAPAPIVPAVPTVVTPAGLTPQRPASGPLPGV